MIGFGAPWVALGKSNLFADSGFILIYEQFMWMYKLRGCRSIIYLPEKCKDIFNERNNPDKTVVYGVFAPGSRVSIFSDDVTLDGNTADGYLAALKSPVDFCITNKKHALQSLKMATRDAKQRWLIPVIYQVLFAGMDGKILHYASHTQRFCDSEAASYLMADTVIWPTTEQRDRGYQICRKVLSPQSIKGLYSRTAIIGGGITPLVRESAYSDEEICKRLQTPQKDFSVSYVGRFNSTKNVKEIFNTVFPLFARDGIKLELISSGDPNDIQSKRIKAGDGKNILSLQESAATKGREYYAKGVLPRLKCMMYASLTEGHPSVPREAIYVGVPVLLPRRPWAMAMMKESYPFFYSDEVEAISLVKRIKEGRVSESECKRHSVSCSGTLQRTY